MVVLVRPVPVRRGSDETGRGRPTVLDLGIAVAGWAVDLLANSDVATNLARGAWSAAAATTAFAASAYVLLCWRRRHPVGVVVGLLLHLLLAISLLPDYRPLVALPVALFTVAVRTPTRASVVVLLGADVVASTAYVLDELSRPLAPLDTPGGVARGIAIAQTLLFVGIWGFGRWVRASRLNARYLQELAELRRRDALRSERASIARDLHDIVSRAVTLMVIQAAGARQLLTSDPARAETALGRVQIAGTEAMAELRQMLGVLRDAQEDVATDGSGDLDIPAIVAPFRAAGLEVDVRIRGDRRRLTPPVVLAATRTLQESMTNALRHANAGATTLIDVEWRDDELRLGVCNDDAPGVRRPETAGLSAGLGLSGLRERVMLVGGRLHAGEWSEGGFEVRARLPVGHDESAGAA